MKEFSPRNLFETVKQNNLKEVKIDLAHRMVTVENRNDLYRLFFALDLATFKTNGNQAVALDDEGAPILAEVSDKVKFKNCFECNSLFYEYPVVVKLGYKDEWTIRGSINRALPTLQET